MLLYVLFISFPVRHTDNFRFDGRHSIGDLMALTMVWNCVCTQWMWQIRFYPHVNKSRLRRKQQLSHIKTNHKNSFLPGFFIWGLRFQIDSFFNGYIEIPLISHCVVKLPVNERKKPFLCDFSFFDTHSWRTLPMFWTLLSSNEYEFVQHFVIFLSGKK